MTESTSHVANKAANTGKCAHCGCTITPDNDSGWDVFIAPSVIQGECQICHDDAKWSAAGQKVEPR